MIPESQKKHFRMFNCSWCKIYLQIVVGTTAIFPVDMVKTRLQATGKGDSGLGGTGGVRYSGPIDCIRKIVTNEGGPRALYRGLVPNLIGVTPEKAIKLVHLVYINMTPIHHDSLSTNML